jgi:hypothetical protein
MRRGRDSGVPSVDQHQPRGREEDGCTSEFRKPIWTAHRPLTSAAALLASTTAAERDLGVPRLRASRRVKVRRQTRPARRRRRARQIGRYIFLLLSRLLWLAGKTARRHPDQGGKERAGLFAVSCSCLLSLITSSCALRSV